MHKSRNKYLSHVNSQVIEVIDLYSASAEDLETVVCFLLFQEIRDLPKKTKYPVTDRLVEMHPPQSASQKPIRFKLLLDGNSNPYPGKPFKYRSKR